MKKILVLGAGLVAGPMVRYLLEREDFRVVVADVDISKAEKLVRDGWSLMLEVNVRTRSQVIKAWNSTLLRKIRKEGQLVAGSSLEEVKRGRRA